MAKVVVTNWVHEGALAPLDRLGVTVVGNHGREPWDEKELRARVADADAMVAFMPDRVDAGLLERLALIKPSALLINPARGSLVDEAAVADASKTGASAAMPRTCSRSRTGHVLTAGGHRATPARVSRQDPAHPAPRLCGRGLTAPNRRGRNRLGRGVLQRRAAAGHDRLTASQVQVSGSPT